MRALPFWDELHLELRCIRAHPGRHAHWLAVFEAIVKGIGEKVGLERERALFRWPERGCWQKGPQAGEAVPLEISLFHATPVTAGQWFDQALHYFDAGEPGRNFQVVATKPPRRHVWAGPEETPPPAWTAAHTWWLDFLTPLPFQPVPHQGRTCLGPAGFVAAVEERIKRLFDPSLLGAPLPLPPAPDLLCEHWRYWEIRHNAHSQPGHVKFINGCIGRLGLTGPERAAWYPWLLLLEQIGMGKRVSFGQGQFILSHTIYQRKQHLARDNEP